MDVLAGEEPSSRLARSLLEALAAHLGMSEGRWQAEIARVAYDKAQAERDFVKSGFLSEAGPMARLIYRELCESRSHVGLWHKRYLDAIKSRRITVADAVEEYLAEL